MNNNRLIKAFPNLEFNKYSIQFSEIKAKVLNKNKKNKNLKVENQKEKNDN